MPDISTRLVNDAARAGLVAQGVDVRMAKLYAGRGVSGIYDLNRSEERRVGKECVP